MILTKVNMRSIDLNQLIFDLAGRGEFESFLLIVPTNRKMRQLKKEFISQAPDKTAERINIESISTFSQKLLLNIKNFTLLSEGAAPVLIRQCSEKINLNYFTSYKKMPFGTLERISNVISEYKKHGITPEILLREVGSEEINEINKAKDIAEIYKSFNKKCKELNAYEIGDIYQELNEIGLKELHKSFYDIYPRTTKLIFQGFNEFTFLEIDLIDKLAELKSVSSFIDFDYYYYNNPVFDHIKKNYERLLSKGFKVITDTSQYSQTKFTEHLKENLFLNQSSKPLIGYGENIKVLEAVSREEEIVSITKEIKRMILEDKVTPNEICLGFNLIKNYSTLIRDKFSAFGIPLNLTDRTSLDNSVPVIALVNFLEIAETRFYHKNLFRGLSNFYLSLKEIDVSNLLKVSSELNILSGYDNWAQVLKAAINDSPTDEYVSPSKIENYRKALNDIQYIHGLLLPFNRKLSVDEFLSGIEQLIVKLELPQNILKFGGEKAEENVKGLTAFIETITEVFRLIEKDEGNSARYDISYFLEQIRTACRWTRFNVKEKSSYGVLVTSLDEIRGLKFDHLFIAGLCDGEFPTRYNPEIFFSGSFRKQEETRQGEERYRFYQALSSWKKKLYLSYPQSDSKKELNESTFLKDFRTVFDTGSVIPSEFDKYLFSKEEVLQSYSTFRNRGGEVKNLVKREENELNEAIELNNKRVASEIFNEFNGWLDPAELISLKDFYQLSDGAKTKLQKEKDKLFSVSQLEKYAACPYKYFLEVILNLSPVEEPSEDIESVEFGNVMHMILFLFSQWLRENDIKLSKCGDEIFQKSMEKLFEIAEGEFDKIKRDPEVSFYEQEKLFGFNGEKRTGILYRYLKNEREDESGFSPVFAEVNFGRKTRYLSDQLLGDEQPLRIGEVKLQGKIDRIELDEQRENFNVVDYKTGGKKVGINEIKSGLFLQLPLYLYAAEKLLSKSLERKIIPALMIIYSLKYQRNIFGKNPLKLSRQKKTNLEEENENLFKELETRINEYVKSISEGKFNLSELEGREDKVCNYCNFKSICRVLETE